MRRESEELTQFSCSGVSAGGEEDNAKPPVPPNFRSGVTAPAPTQVAAGRKSKKKKRRRRKKGAPKGYKHAGRSAVPSPFPRDTAAHHLKVNVGKPQPMTKKNIKKAGNALQSMVNQLDDESDDDDVVVEATNPTLPKFNMNRLSFNPATGPPGGDRTSVASLNMARISIQSYMSDADSDIGAEQYDITNPMLSVRIANETRDLSRVSAAPSNRAPLEPLQRGNKAGRNQGQGGAVPRVSDVPSVLHSMNGKKKPGVGLQEALEQLEDDDDDEYDSVYDTDYSEENTPHRPGAATGAANLLGSLQDQMANAQGNMPPTSRTTYDNSVGSWGTSGN